jgi:predicted CXXCH cytochrome family protein
MRSNSALKSLIVAAVAAAALACSSESVVFRDRAPFNPPPDAATGFLGYYDATQKQTTCGNCHVDYQTRWVTTAHAGAYATLEASPAKQGACYSCHTVTGLGNVASGTVAGYDAVEHVAYRDVQCESCHGPGLAHVEAVGRGQLIRPLAKLSMTGTGNCGDCHSGAHQPFAEEWGASRHANLNASRAANPSCIRCHEGRGALASWGDQSNFQEKAVATAYLPPATCGVCHDPHGSDNPSQLRFPIETTDPEQNLCIRCHLRYGQPENNPASPTSFVTSPHAPQGAMLLGTAGWRPPNLIHDDARIFGSHSTDANPKLCAGCHIAKFQVTDQLTGAFVFNATGHLMRPIPCLDAEGKPTADKNCAYSANTRSWQTCTGCHGSPEAVANVFNSNRNLIRNLANVLWNDLNGNGQLQAAPTDGGLLATVRAQQPGEWSATDGRTSPAEGAEFNARLCGEYGQSTSDNSKGVHNPFLCRDLLLYTAEYLRSYYPYLPQSSNPIPARSEVPATGGGFQSSMRASATLTW